MQDHGASHGSAFEGVDYFGSEAIMISGFRIQDSTRSDIHHQPPIANLNHLFLNFTP